MGQSQVSQRVHMGSVVQAPCSSAAPSSRAIGHGLGNASLSLSFRRRASPLRPTTARSELVVPSPHQQSRLQCRKPGRPAGRDNFRDHRSHWVAAAVEKIRSPIANDARALPAASPRVPTSTRASHRTATRRAHARAPPTTSPLEHNQPHTRDAHAQPSKQSAHIANTQSTFAQHTLPWHCMTPLLRASPSPGPSPPSPGRGSAPPRPSGRPALPITLCATCPAANTCAHPASAIAAQTQATRATSHAQ